MNKHQQKIVIMFLLPIFILSVFKIVWPDREVSQRENRTLQQKPVFTWNSFLDGSFGRSVEDWYADQFPFRDSFIQVDNGVRQLLSMSFSDDHVTLIQGPANDLGSGQVLTETNEDNTKEQSGNEFQSDLDTKSTNSDEEVIEKNEETVKPAENGTETDNANQSNNPEDSEKEELEQTREEDLETATENENSTARPGVEGEVENYSAVIIVNNVAMEIYGFNQKKADYYTELINKLASKTESAQIYSLLAPTAIEFYSPAKYHSLSSSQQSSIDYIYSGLADNARSVDAYSQLANHWQEYVYFRSDHHWTALGAYYGYRAFAESAGFKPVELSELEHGSIPGDFLGSLYRYTQSSSLAANPDVVNYYEPRVEVSGKAYADESMSSGRSIKLINKNASAGSQYLAFIEGDHPLAHFKTSTDNGRSIFVVKESYGNAFVPYLANHYENIYVADTRSINMNLPAFVSKHNIDDIVIINYTFAVSNQQWVEGFSRMID